MTRDEEILRDYRNRLVYLYAKANTKSKKKRIIYDLCALSELYTMYPNIDAGLEWKEDITMASLMMDDNIPFVNYIEQNKELFSNVFGNVINIFKEEKFDFYRDYMKSFKRLADNITDELIVAFLGEYDQNLLDEYRKLKKDGKIIDNDTLRNCGIIYSLGNLDENLIFPINDENNSVYTASIVVHELGHLLEYDTFKTVGNINAMAMTNTLPYYEVTSRFLEYAFLNYLKENGIYRKDTEMALRNYYIDLFMNAFDISVLYKVKNVMLDSSDSVLIEDDDVIDFANGIMNYVNVHSLEMCKGDRLDYRDSFIYGIGDIFSICMYQNYTDNPKEFKKELKNVMLSYPYTKNIMEFERVGITREKLLDGKELRKVLIKTKETE